MAMGFGVGLFFVITFGITSLTDRHELNFMPRMEMIGLALGLLPSSAWAGRQISQRIGGPNRDAAFSILKNSALVGILSMAGLLIGSKLGTKILGVAFDFSWTVELQSDFLFVLIAFFSALILASVLAWPFHQWFKRSQGVA